MAGLYLTRKETSADAWRDEKEDEEAQIDPG